MLNYLGMPAQASTHAGEIDQMMVLVHWLMLVLFVGWGLFFLFVLFRFRKGANPKASYVGAKGKIAKSTEIAVAIVEVVLLIGYAIPAWAKRVRTSRRSYGNPERDTAVPPTLATNVRGRSKTWMPGCEASDANALACAAIAAVAEGWPASKLTACGLAANTDMAAAFEIPADCSLEAAAAALLTVAASEFG